MEKRKSDWIHLVFDIGYYNCNPPDAVQFAAKILYKDKALVHEVAARGDTLPLVAKLRLSNAVKEALASGLRDEEKLILILLLP